MVRVQVKPSGNMWRVTRGGVTKSNHRKQKPAIRKARKIARSGDTLIIQNSKGRIRQRTRVR